MCTNIHQIIEEYKEETSQAEIETTLYAMAGQVKGEVNWITSVMTDKDSIDNILSPKSSFSCKPMRPTCYRHREKMPLLEESWHIKNKEEDQ